MIGALFNRELTSEERRVENPKQRVVSVRLETERLKALSDNVKKSGIEFARAIAPPVNRASRALHDFGQALDKAAQNEYLKYHSRLPGGTGNPRLRKKRRTVAMNWFMDKVKKEDVETIDAPGRLIRFFYILRCPHCRAEQTINSSTYAAGMSFVECAICGAGGPTVKQNEDYESVNYDAITVWNARAGNDEECPWCAATSDLIEYEFSGSQGFTLCKICGATGPDDEMAADPHCDRDAAFDAWKKRAI